MWRCWAILLLGTVAVVAVAAGIETTFPRPWHEYGRMAARLILGALCVEWAIRDTRALYAGAVFADARVVPLRRVRVAALLYVLCCASISGYLFAAAPAVLDWWGGAAIYLLGGVMVWAGVDLIERAVRAAVKASLGRTTAAHPVSTAARSRF